MVSCLVTLLVGVLNVVLTDGLLQQGCGMGAPVSLRGKILGGEKSSSGMWPWQVGIYKQRRPSKDSRYDIICGGALIDPQWVVTAAHCFYVKRIRNRRIWFKADIKSLKKYKIIAGDINTQIIEHSQQERHPIEVHIHPGYRHSPYYQNDIALIKLNQTVTTSPLVGTVCLPGTYTDLAQPETVGTVAGWGKSEHSKRSTSLLHISIVIKPDTVCKQATRYYVNKTVTFCAGDDKGRDDTCHGDSGGSMVRRVMVKGQERWTTVGLVSWGEGCGLAGKYGYYTRIHPFVPWIKDTVDSLRISCSHPGDIPFGKPINAERMTKFPINTRVKYRCVVGYILKGKSRRKCKADGKWTRPPVCVKEKYCPLIASPLNGVSWPSKERYRYKDKIQFQCDKNHVMLGKVSLSCLIDGQWNGYPPLCLAPCQDPGIPKYSIRLGDNFKHSKTVRFVCKNRAMNGTPSITCNNGIWSGDPPKCGKAFCKDPGIPKGGRRLHHSFLHGDKVSFSCNKGRKINGAKTITCSDGKWNQKVPTCRHEGCLRPSLSTSVGYVSTEKDFYKDKESVWIGCYEDYVQIGNSSARCSDGKWSKDPPSCKRKCPNPGSPYYGWAVGSDYYEGKQVRFRCQNGYNVIGRSIIQCLDTGHWSGKVPQCKRRCIYRVPANSMHRPYFNTSLVASLKHGTTISFNCIKDYTLVGQKTIKCEDGVWQPSIPSCKAPCPDPGSISNGYQITNDPSSFVHGSLVGYACEYGYRINSRGPLICNDGKWSKKVPSCKKTCDNPGIPKNGHRIGNDFQNNARVAYICNKNTKRVGASSSRCNNGTWSSPVPKCLEICPNLVSPTNGKMNGYRQQPLSGDKVSFSCNVHYDLVGSKEISCINGTWNGVVPLCLGKCRVPNNTNNLISSIQLRSGDMLSSDTTVKVSCPKGSKLVGRKNVTCQNGSWSHVFPECKGRTSVVSPQYGGECTSAIGMESGKILGRSIRSSSYWDWVYRAAHGRLNHRFSWCSSVDDIKPYLEIDLGKPYKIAHVATQGLGAWNYWVSRYAVSHSLAGSSFIEYRDTVTRQLFAGNDDGTSIVKHKLKEPFIARKVRFHPVVYGFNSACMRVEVYGCDLPTECVTIGSRVLGKWSSHHSGGDVYYKAYVKNISRYTVQLKIEDEKFEDGYFQTIPKGDIVLNVPNKQLDLPTGTRVLMPSNNKYFTATTGVRLHQDFFIVNPDNSQLRPKWIRKSNIRVLEPEQFCES